MGDPEHKKSGRSSLTLAKDHSHAKSLGTMSMSRIKLRRHSFGFSGVMGIRPVERTSTLGMEFKRPALIYLPTYQLEPYHPFNVEVVTKVIEKIIDENFSEHKYNAQDSPALALRLSGQAMHDVKTLGYHRHRIISVVTVGQKRAQSYNNALAFVWDHERDNYVDTSRETATAFIQITLLAIYLD